MVNRVTLWFRFFTFLRGYEGSILAVSLHDLTPCSASLGLVKWVVLAQGPALFAGQPVQAFVWLSGERQGPAKGLGGGVGECHLSMLLSTVRMESGQGSFIALGGPAGVCRGSDTEGRFCTSDFLPTPVPDPPHLS